jgi:hypothetical protein
MRYKTSTRSIKALMREAKRKGKKDGMHQIPRQEWGTGSVPYLSRLQGRFNSYLLEIDLAHDARKLSQEQIRIEKIEKSFQRGEKSNCADANLLQVIEGVNQTRTLLGGVREEAALTKFSRVRMIGNAMYLPFLFLLFIGEFTITAPAFRVLLGERLGPSLTVALAVSGLSVGAAHISGIYVKSQSDRSTPKPGVFHALFIAVGALLLLTIVFLGYIRASNSALTSGNLSGIPEDSRVYFLWGFYCALQLTFVVTGAAISFMHYSPLHSEMVRAQVKAWYQRRIVAWHRSRNAHFDRQVSDMNQQKLIDLQRAVGETEKLLIRTRYFEVAAAYREANIACRNDDMRGSHAALTPLELDSAFASTHVESREMENWR